MGSPRGGSRPAPAWPSTSAPAARLGCEAELADVERILRVGASYQRQRAVAAQHDGDLRPVVDSLLAELRDGLPATGSAGTPAGPVPGPADCAGGPAA